MVKMRKKVEVRDRRVYKGVQFHRKEIFSISHQSIGGSVIGIERYIFAPIASITFSYENREQKN